MSSFIGDLAINLTLTIAGQAYAIPPGNVKNLDIKLHAYGYEGSISFVKSCESNTDDLFIPLTQNDLIELSLQVQSVTVGQALNSQPLTLHGLVISRSFSEQTLSNVLKTQDYLHYRHYQLRFADPAQVLWRQHFPCDLFTNSTLKNLIKAHTPPQINLNYSWNVLDVTHPVLSLSLGASGLEVSFYDYLLWLVDNQNGVFSYDCTKNSYSLASAKTASESVLSLIPEEIADFGVDFPEIIRYQPNVLNSYAKNSQTIPICNTQSVTNIRRDYTTSYPIVADMQARVVLETARLKQPMHEVRVQYQLFQVQVTAPGQLVNFKGSAAWSSKLFVYPNTYRVKEWRLNASTPGQELELNLNNDHGHYTIDHSLQLEHSSESRVSLPPYKSPVYPVFVEGTIVSDTGEDTDSTYKFYTDAETSVNYYLTSIPLWDKQNVRTAYQPNMDTGQFYFPPYKHARVLIGLYFDSAAIAAFLDWGTGTALTLESQGNQLVMGKSVSSQNIVKHRYVDSKPELQIQRTQDKDTELLQFSDGYIILQTMLSEGEG